MAYGYFKDLNRITATGKILREKAINVAKYPKYDGYHRGIASVIYTFFDKKTYGERAKNENICNKELAKELHKATARKFNKSKVCSPVILIKDLDVYYLLLIFIVNMHGLFLQKIKKELQLITKLLKNF